MGNIIIGAKATLMRIVGFMLLLSGWGIVLSAVILLGSAPARMAFVVTGMALECLGLVFVAHRRGRRA